MVHIKDPLLITKSGCSGFSLSLYEWSLILVARGVGYLDNPEGYTSRSINWIGRRTEVTLSWTKSDATQAEISSTHGKKEGNVLFSDVLNTHFYLRSHGVRHMIKDH